MRLPVQGIPAPSCLRTSWWWWLVGFFHLLLCSTAPGKRLPPATGAASHLQLTSDFGLPSALLPFPLGAARPAARRDMQSLLGYTLAPWRLEAAFFLFWGENWGRNKQRSYVGNGLSFQQGPTITHSCGRTEAVHLPEMRERTAVMLAVSSGCEQRKRTFYLLQFPARLFPYSTTRYYQDTGARCPKSLQEAKNRCHLYFGRTQGVLPVHFAEISPPPGTPWPPILQHHVQLRAAETTACIGQTALDGGEGREGEKVPFPFITRAVGLWTQLPLGWITNTHPTA